jgi:hypothetical protein
MKDLEIYRYSDYNCINLNPEHIIKQQDIVFKIQKILENPGFTHRMVCGWQWEDVR